MISCLNCGNSAEELSPMVAFNRCAYLVAQMISLRDRIPEVEKLSRRTPPKSLLAEWEKVERAKKELPILKKQLEEGTAEILRLSKIADWYPTLFLKGNKGQEKECQECEELRDNKQEK